MNVELMNMCMIHDRDTDRVLVLDKVKKEGWEGLTFPGGHVEPFESFRDSVIREVEEETGLIIVNPIFKGFVEWMNTVTHTRQVGLLYYTDSYEGEMLSTTREGDVFWMDFDEFIRCPHKSFSMDDCMRIYLDDEITEGIAHWDGKTLSPFSFY